MNRFPLWKNLIVVVTVVAGLLIALPNLFGEAPALQVGLANGEALTDSGIEHVNTVIASQQIEGATPYVDKGRLMVRFPSVDIQLKAADSLRAALGKDHVVALTLTPNTPAWLRAIGLRPVPLGLDLRGGPYFLFEVDIATAIKQRLDSYAGDFNKLLRDNRIRRSISVAGDEVRIRLPDAADAERAEELIRESDPDVLIEQRETGESAVIVVQMTPVQIKERQDFAIQQNVTTLRNRVNELGVAEPVVQRQGLDRIVVQLPGVQDPAQAERVLGATATLEFRLVCDDANPLEAERTGRAPLGCELFQSRDGGPV
ncbi:MAG: protein translocase subunit SecD, partial [Gammaproteobacteria bacterium]|nr:protein translocase subunit SecD [Gammaproteobacteria bacterium]